jgi:hypothetical protein
MLARPAGQFAARVWGHGSRVGLRHRRTAQQISEASEAEEREGRTPLDRPPPGRSRDLGADTAVSIEREVVSGHAYAIPAAQPADGGRCGYDNPTNLSVDGVLTYNPGPRRFRAGALVMEVYVAQPDDMFGDDDYPAYTMGRAAEITGASQDFLRRLDEAKLITPFRSAGGHRRYSRYQLRLAARAREMVDQGTALEAACRIIILEDQLEEALRQNEDHQRSQETGLL